MVWPTLGNKTSSHLAAKKEGDRDMKRLKSSCNKCGDRCKKCGLDCKCRITRVYLRAPMFNYFTDLMH